MTDLANPLLMNHTQEISVHNLCEAKQKLSCFQYSNGQFPELLTCYSSLPPFPDLFYKTSAVIWVLPEVEVIKHAAFY